MVKRLQIPISKAEGSDFVSEPSVVDKDEEAGVCARVWRVCVRARLP